MQHTPEDLKATWKRAVIKVAMWPAQIILRDPKAATDDDDQDIDTVKLLAKIIPLFVIGLSAASISNLSVRAYEHHKNPSSYVTGFGLATLVPVAVFAALRIKNWSMKIFAWVVAALFAAISGMIQYNVYLPADTNQAGVFVWEAIAFGYGVPVAECLLAMIEGVLVWQIEQDRVARAADEERRRADEEERERRRKTEDEDHERERQAKAAADLRQQQDEEEERQRRQRQQEMDDAYQRELNAIRLDDERRKREVAYQAKLRKISVTSDGDRPRNAKASTGATSAGVHTGESLDSDTQSNTEQQDAMLRQSYILSLLGAGKKISPKAIGDRFGVTRQTIYRDLEALQQNGKIRKTPNNDGVEEWRLNDGAHPMIGVVPIYTNGTAINGAH